MSHQRPLYQILASRMATFVSMKNSNDLDKMRRADDVMDEIHALTKRWLPSGSGYDKGTTFDEDKSSPDKLVFHTSYHHMDEHGGYAGWTEHDLIASPSLAHDFDLRVTGRDRNQIKDMIHTDVHSALRRKFTSKFEDGEMCYTAVESDGTTPSERKIIFHRTRYDTWSRTDGVNGGCDFLGFDEAASDAAARLTGVKE